MEQHIEVSNEHEHGEDDDGFDNVKHNGKWTGHRWEGGDGSSDETQALVRKII